MKRKRVLQVGGVGMATAMVLLAVAQPYKSSGLVVAGCFLFIVMFEVSIGTVQ